MNKETDPKKLMVEWLAKKREVLEVLFQKDENKAEDYKQRNHFVDEVIAKKNLAGVFPQMWKRAVAEAARNEELNNQKRR